MLINKRKATGILDVRTLRGAGGVSDHYLVRIKHRSLISVVGGKNQQKVIKFNLDGLKSTKIRKKCGAAISERVPSINMEMNESGTV
jgi:hypothetical protein